MSTVRPWPARKVVVVDGATGKSVASDLRGLHTDRPDADAVPVGATWWSVDEPSAPGTVYVSDGTTWATLVEL